jgi:hypothetical protein
MNNMERMERVHFLSMVLSRTRRAATWQFERGGQHHGAESRQCANTGYDLHEPCGRKGSERSEEQANGTVVRREKPAVEISAHLGSLWHR